MTNKEILFFTGNDCNSCKMIKKQLKNMHFDIKIKEISIDDSENAKLATKHFVNSLPTLIYCENDIPKKTYIGSNALDKMIQENIIQ